MLCYRVWYNLLYPPEWECVYRDCGSNHGTIHCTSQAYGNHVQQPAKVMEGVRNFF